MEFVIAHVTAYSLHSRNDSNDVAISVSDGLSRSWTVGSPMHCGAVTLVVQSARTGVANRAKVAIPIVSAFMTQVLHLMPKVTP
jgi:hypothetical protein